jgi:hypothetical protein
MPPIRRLKRTRGQAVEHPISAKRARRPATSSLAAFNASRLPTKVSKRATRTRNDKPTPNTPTLVLVPPAKA